jgi:hypothetical protein
MSQTATVTSYHPEMGESADPTALFHTQHNFRDSYSIQWLVSRDTEARAALKRLRIRPRNVRQENSATYSTPFDGDIYAALITSQAEDKLADAGLRCLKMLLD